LVYLRSNKAWPKRGPFVRFLMQFNNVLVYVLLAAGFTKLVMNLWLDGSRKHDQGA
jgi:hypothetical protein